MLRLENLAKLYGLKVVFKGVSCRFTAGSITLLAETPGLRGRVRSVESFGRAVPRSRPGARTALGLADVSFQLFDLAPGSRAHVVDHQGRVGVHKAQALGAEFEQRQPRKRPRP